MQFQNNAKHFTTYHMEVMNIYFSKVSCENNFKFKTYHAISMDQWVLCIFHRRIKLLIYPKINIQSNFNKIFMILVCIQNQI